MANFANSASLVFNSNWKVFVQKLNIRPFIFGTKQINLNNSGSISTLQFIQPSAKASSSIGSICQIHFCAQRLRMMEGTEGVTPPIPMTEDEVYQRVIKAIKEWDRFPQDRASKLGLDARFAEDLSFDSLDLVEILMSLEDEFGIEISIEASENFKTPRDVANYIIEYEGINEEHEF
ncbi:Acyl carrier protein [Meloidogyne graminicola]|uniref:Acyl carrier protein n=1 Tax=Meloidogyne graminicola TaxID=189291 RepID=A0A8S9ZZ26_9BILA|nr:Acyl carrier protein [Meloidogyne graminicola]